MSVQRLRDEMDVDELVPGQQARSSSRPSSSSSGSRGHAPLAEPSRRGSLAGLVREDPDDDADHTHEHEARDRTPSEAERHESQGGDEHASLLSEAAARSLSPLPGAVEFTASTSSKRPSAAARQLDPYAASAAISSTSSKRPGRAMEPRYTTTLEEDAARDEAEAEARAHEQQRLLDEEAEDLLRQRQQARSDSQASRHARRPSASRSRHGGGSFAHADMSEPVIGQSLGLASRRRSFIQDEVVGMVQQHEYEGGAGLPGAVDVEEPLIDRHVVDSDADLIQPARRVSHSMPGAPEQHHEHLASPSYGGEIAAARPKRKYLPDTDGARPSPSPPPPQAESSEGEASDEDSDHGAEERPRRDSISRSAASQRHSEARAPPSPSAEHADGGDEIPASEAYIVAQPEDKYPDEPLPVFERPVRRYAAITDPAAELARIRATKDFESEFDDITLPTFLSGPPSYFASSGSGAKPRNPLKQRFDEVHALVDAEVAAPIASVDDASLLDEILGVGRMTLGEAAAIERELEADRLEELQQEMQRAARREIELATFQHALLVAHEEAQEGHTRDLLEREHQLLQSARLLMKDEQECFRRTEDKVRSWLARNKNARLNTEMLDLVDPPAPKPKEEKSGPELKERGDATNATKPTAEEDKIEASRTEIHDLYARVRSRKYEVTWNYEPRLVRIRLDWLRCLKNKLPLGNYSIMVTLYDRLGGSALRWSTGAGRTDGGKPSTCFSHTGATAIPQRHDGRFYNLELSFHQKANRIFLACPSMLLSRPSMVFVFELFLMGDASVRLPVGAPGHGRRASIMESAADFAGRATVMAQEMALKVRDPRQYALLKAAQVNAAEQALRRAPPSSDRVVAWGAFPMAHINFELIKGKFKVPLLRGPYEGGPDQLAQVEKFKTVQEKIAEDLDHWLANLYFDVRHWPRLLDHAKENHVELHFKGKKLGGSGGVDGAEDDSSDEEEPEELVGEDGALAEDRDDEAGQEAGEGALLNADGLDIEADILTLDDGALGHHLNSGSGPHNSHLGARGLEHHIDLSGLRGRGGGQASAGAGSAANSIKSRTSKKGAKSGIAKSAAAAKAMKHDAVTSTERRMKIKLHTRRFPGMLLDLPDLDEGTWNDLRNIKKRDEQTKRYRFNVNLTAGEDVEVEGTASHANNPLGRRAAYKMRYISHEIWGDMDVRHPRDWQFFFFLIFISLWARIYSHYLGQYLFLASVYVPITKYACTWYTCDIDYVWDPQSITAQTQIGVVIIGVVTNMIVLIVGVGVVRTIQRILGRTPAWFSRLLLAWAVGTVVEPLLILLIDMCQSRWYGDSFKLYQYYLSQDGNGVAGIFMTILLQLLLITIATLMAYFYILYVHMNGRILDVHYRLHGRATDFHIPHDLEISVRELRWILLKARRWVGLGGQKRKIAVSKFRTRDPLRRATALDVSVYIAIYTQALNGDVELFRHFLRGPTGAVVEVFDSFETPGEEAFKRIEEKLAAHGRRGTLPRNTMASLKLNTTAGATAPNTTSTSSSSSATIASTNSSDKRSGPTPTSPSTPGTNALAGKARLRAMVAETGRGGFNLAA